MWPYNLVRESKGEEHKDKLPPHRAVGYFCSGFGAPQIFFLLVIAIVVPMLYLLFYVYIWSFWLTRGKDILFVYSDSPIWRDYMLSEMLPLVETRAVVLNWSERRTWKRWSLRALAFTFFSGH